MIDEIVSDFDDAKIKVSKIKRFIKSGEYNADIARCIPGTLDLVFQGMLQKITIIGQPGTLPTKSKKPWTLMLDKNYYTKLKKSEYLFPNKN